MSLTIICATCAKQFILSDSDIAYLESKKYQTPKHCLDCRKDRRANAPRQLYDAVCATCSKPCQVPFKPVEGRPVYCRDCYQPKSKSQVK